MISAKKLIYTLIENLTATNALAAYPVGALFETTDADFNPNTAWGGTWVLEDAGKFLMSAGTGYAAGTTGGKKDAIIPYHNHSFVNPTIGITHNVEVSMSSAGQHSHTYAYVNRTSFEESGSGTQHFAHGGYVATDTAQAGLHTHTLTVKQPTFSATNGAVGYRGESVTDANLPPYVAVNRWHRTA